MLKEKIVQKIREMDVDPSELDSATVIRNPYGLEEPYSSMCSEIEYDENELWNRKVDLFLSTLRYDGAEEMFGCNDRMVDRIEAYAETLR